MALTPVIMAGGSGSRLWPLSRQAYPKQFLPLLKEGSMLRDTVKRAYKIESTSSIVIGNEEHRFLIAEQLRQESLGSFDILLEPEGKNTAPAIALAAFQAMKEDKDAILLVLAADHIINDEELFRERVLEAKALAEQGELVTFGVAPTSAETGYGYIEKGQEVSSIGFRVKRFVEKPNLETAERYLLEDKYYWNSGMFLFRADRYIDELEKSNPKIVDACRKSIEGARKDLDFIRVDAEAFSASPVDSIDYAVMEHSDYVCMVPLDVGWSDIGSWSSLWEVSEKDEYGNTIKGDFIHHDCNNMYVNADHRLVAAVGLENIVVVETKDAVLVADKNRVQEVKEIVEQLKAENRTEYRSHREVYRPWGLYDCVDIGERYQVKRITVNPGAKLSVQMHHHRAEHWVVVLGTAKVFSGDEYYFVSENQSTYIPVGEIHSLENPGKIPLELIEVQSGSYLGEDDIVRFDDNYGRL